MEREAVVRPPLFFIFYVSLHSGMKTTEQSSSNRIKYFLAGLSFRTGIIILILCLLSYAISFVQMLFPLSVTTKGILWTIFFGLAKALQYSALLIFGKAGVDRLKSLVGRNKANNTE